MATRQARHNSRTRARKKQQGFEQDSNGEPRARTSTKKKMPQSFDDDVWLWLPDKSWAPIPFTDADVPPGELEKAKDRAVHAMAEWGVLVEASRASGIGRNRLKSYMREDANFKARMKDARINNNERIEREMRRRGQLPKGELAAIFVMKHNIPRYREIQRVELTGKDGAPVAYADVKGELLKRIEQIALKQNQGAIAVGERPRLIKGGSGDVEVHTIKKHKGQGFEAKSRK